MRLSENFTLEEFLVSGYAMRHDIDMTPPDDVLANLQELVDTCMQPLRYETGPIAITSGFRPLALNKGIGGSSTSAHMYGGACDFTVAKQTPLETSTLIVELELPFDQVIHEFGKWVHLGIATVLRRQELTAYRLKGKTAYSIGLHSMESLQ